MKRLNVAGKLARAERYAKKLERSLVASAPTLSKLEDLKLRRREKREQLLDQLVPTRVCPRCKVKHLAPRMWNVREFEPGKWRAQCRSCERLERAAQRMGEAVPAPASDESETAMVVTRPTYVVRGRALARARACRGMHAFQLAELLCISRPKLSRIESSFETLVDETLAARVLAWAREPVDKGRTAR